MEFGSLPPRPRRPPGGGSGGQPPDVDELGALLGRPGRAAGVVAGELAEPSCRSRRLSSGSAPTRWSPRPARVFGAISSICSKTADAGVTRFVWLRQFEWEAVPRERGRLGDKVAEALPARIVRDHRVEGPAGVPRAEQRRPELRECPERVVCGRGLPTVYQADSRVRFGGAFSPRPRASIRR